MGGILVGGIKEGGVDSIICEDIERDNGFVFLRDIERDNHL